MGVKVKSRHLAGVLLARTPARRRIALRTTGKATDGRSGRDFSRWRSGACCGPLCISLPFPSLLGEVAAGWTDGRTDGSGCGDGWFSFAPLSLSLVAHCHAWECRVMPRERFSPFHGLQLQILMINLTTAK